MFDQAPKRAVIVYRKKDDEYAHLMANLMSAYTEYEVAVWEEKEWLANQATTSSTQKVIFLGDSKEAHKRHRGIAWVYNQHNMKFGWLGNQCVIDIDLLASHEIAGFCDYYQQKAIEHEELFNIEVFQLPEEIFKETPIENENESFQKDISEPSESSQASVKPIIVPDEKKPKGIRSIIAKAPNIPKQVTKLGSEAVTSASSQIARVKLLRFQHHLIIYIFILSGGLKEFMES